MNQKDLKRISLSSKELNKTFEELSKEFETAREASHRLSMEYHTLIARLKRDAKSDNPKYVAARTKWGWIIKKGTLEQGE